MLPFSVDSCVDDNSSDVTLPKKPISPTSAEKSSEDSSKEIGSEEDRSIINIKTSVRPLWSLKQRLFKDEPPKPPK